MRTRKRPERAIIHDPSQRSQVQHCSSICQCVCVSFLGFLKTIHNSRSGRREKTWRAWGAPTPQRSLSAFCIFSAQRYRPGRTLGSGAHIWFTKRIARGSARSSPALVSLLNETQPIYIHFNERPCRSPMTPISPTFGFWLP